MRSDIFQTSVSNKVIRNGIVACTSVYHELNKRMPVRRSEKGANKPLVHNIAGPPNLKIGQFELERKVCNNRF